MTPSQYAAFVAEHLTQARLLLARAELEFHEEPETAEPVKIFAEVNGAIAELQTLADGLEKHAKAI